VLLWHQRQRRLLTEAAYDRLGGEGRSALTAAIAEKADATVSALTPRQREIARRILLRLVQLGEGRQDTRRQEPIEALHSSADSPTEFETTLQHLTANRLLTLSGQESDQPRVDLAHEALITGWPQLHDWIRDNRDNLRLQRAIFEDAQHWDELGRDPDALYRGARLEAAGTWADTHHDELNDLERDFIQASREDAAARKRRQRRTTLLLRGLTALLLFASAAATVVSLQASRANARAAESAARSERLLSREIARQAGAYGLSDSGSSVAFGSGGEVLAITRESASPEVLQAEITLWDVSSAESRVVEVGDADARATATAFSRDGNVVAWAYARGTKGEIVVWDLQRDQEVVPPIALEAGYAKELRFGDDLQTISWVEVDSPSSGTPGNVLYGDEPTVADIVMWDLAEGRRINPRPQESVLQRVDFYLREALSANGETALLTDRIDVPQSAGMSTSMGTELEDDSEPDEPDVWPNVSAPLFVFLDVATSEPIGELNILEQVPEFDLFYPEVTVTLSPDGTVAAVKTSDGQQPFYWQIADGVRRDILGLPTDYEGYSRGFSRNGEVGVIDVFGRDESGAYGGSFVTDVHTGEVVGARLPDAHGLSLSEDGLQAAYFTFDEDESGDMRNVGARMWDVAAGRAIGQPLPLGDLSYESRVKIMINTQKTVCAVTIEDDEFGDGGSRTLLWDTETGRKLELNGN
jgi:hypothetical protein